MWSRHWDGRGLHPVLPDLSLSASARYWLLLTYHQKWSSPRISAGSFYWAAKWVVRRQIYSMCSEHAVWSLDAVPLISTHKSIDADSSKANHRLAQWFRLAILPPWSARLSCRLISMPRIIEPVIIVPSTDTWYANSKRVNVLRICSGTVQSAEIRCMQTALAIRTTTAGRTDLNLICAQADLMHSFRFSVSSARLSPTHHHTWSHQCDCTKLCTIFVELHGIKKRHNDYVCPSTSWSLLVAGWCVYRWCDEHSSNGSSTEALK